MRCVQCEDAPGVRFDLPHLLAVKQSDSRDRVRFGPGEDLLEPVGLVRVLCNEQLTALAVGDAAFGHERDQQLHTSVGELRLRRSRLRGEGGIHDTRGVPALMCGHAFGLVEDGDFGVREPAGDLAGERHSDDSGTDHGHS